jgi:S-formylglutathione hydrolase
MPSTISLGELPAPFAVLTPMVEEALPLCVLLLGAGGTRDSLADLQPLFEEWWAEGAVPRMVVATLTPGKDYVAWDGLLTDEFIPQLRATCKVSEATVVAGISGGGYGALKLAFARPDLFTAVAVMQPMLEPGWRESDVGPRNRLHHTTVGSLDTSVWEENNPANRARANTHAIRKSGMTIYIDAADQDFLNAHDGAEFLHRALWDLDIPHEYHLVNGADHGGPSMRPRMRSMFAWLGRAWNSDDAVEAATRIWIESGMQGKPPAGATTTQAFIEFLRTRFEPVRAEAAKIDPTTARRLGKL